jgi:hypothetical protein
MAPHLDFLEELPVRAVLDGELVAFGGDSKPDFPSLCERMLHRHAEIPLTFLIFDLLSVDGRDLRRRPYRQRRRILQGLDLQAPGWWVPRTARVNASSARSTGERSGADDEPATPSALATSQHHQGPKRNVAVGSGRRVRGPEQAMLRA